MLRATQFVFTLAALLFAFIAAPAPADPPAIAQTPPGPPSPAQPPAGEVVHPPLVDLAEALIVEALPRHYINERGWNRQKHFTTGLKVERRGLKIETRRRKELVNHGTWKRYWVDIPAGEKMRLEIGEIRVHDGGKVTFRITAESPLAGRAELQQWQRGVRLLGISADCEARVRLTLEAEAVLKTESGLLLPAVSIAPKVIAARAELLDFRLRRIGDLGGSLAKELGEAAEPALRREVADQDAKIAERLNKSLAKRAESLRVSGDDFLEAKWEELKGKLKQ